MAQGFCPALLRHISDIADENAPGRKLHIAGFLAMTLCCQNSSVSPVNDGFQNGHNRPLTVAYRRRPLVSTVQSVDNCDINSDPSKEEWTLPGLTHKQHTSHIEDSLIRQYCEDASRMRTIGAPPTQVMEELYDIIRESANAVLLAVNQDLVTKMATEFGANAATGDDGGTAINISTNTQSFDLDNGIVQMYNDFQDNQFCGEPCVVGAGNYRAFMNMRQAGMVGLNAGGVNNGAGALPRFFFDPNVNSIWGANSIGVFAPGSVKLIAADQYVRGFAGPGGTSFFTNFALPVDEFGCADDCLSSLRFDLQLRYNDCPEGGRERGWSATVSKKYALWVQPDTGFSVGDPLAGTNGTLKYWVGNDAYTGPAYARY